MHESEIRKTKIVTLTVSAFILILFIIVPIIFVVYSCNALFPTTEEFMGSFTSPDGRYTVEFYLVKSDESEDTNVKGYLIDNYNSFNKKTAFYHRYNSDTLEMEWISNTEILVNGVTLDVRHDTYCNTAW